MGRSVFVFQYQICDDYNIVITYLILKHKNFTALILSVGIWCPEKETVTNTISPVVQQIDNNNYHVIEGVVTYIWYSYISDYFKVTENIQ